MTANFAYGFVSEGHEVTVFLPETASHGQSARLSSLKKTLSDLDRVGVDFEIRIIHADTDLGRYDLGVWQSYFADDEAFFPAFRKAVKVVAKNFPRLLVGERARDIRALAGSANRFDIVGLALREDKRIADELLDEIPQAVARSIYMPRGFRPDWFKSPELAGPPVFGLEKGVDVDSNEYAFLIPVLQRLRFEFGQVDVIGARLNDPAITTSTLGLLPPRDFYERFLNPLWAYLMIDVNRSRQSMNAVTVGGKKVYLGLYENQVIEAQLAGAAVMGHADALPEELVASTKVALRFEDFGATDELFDFLAYVIQNREAVSVQATNWARVNHSVANMVRPLLQAL